MNVSWNDLNNVREAGEYPFRDGTITVTFAEAAIWKEQPDTQFPLLRKHPIQGMTRYVLGAPAEHHHSHADAQPFYESSNGDTWRLAENPVSGAPAVMHQPNVQSGGKPSYVDVDQFLAGGASGPEHQALRGLLERQTQLATILITCDIHPPKGDAFDKLFASVKTLGAWWHHLETTWIVKSGYTPIEIRDRLRSCIGSNDQLLVIDISGDVAQWVGVNDSGSRWLNDNI